MNEPESIHIRSAIDEAHPVSPMDYINLINMVLTKKPGLSGYDEQPIRWIVAIRTWGIVVTDSAHITDGFIFRQDEADFTQSPRKAPVLHAVLEWLADHIPASQYWAVSFRQGTNPVPTSREVI